MSQRNSAKLSHRQQGSSRPSARGDGKRGISLGPPAVKQSSRSKLVLEQNILAAQLINGENPQGKEEEEV